MTDPLTITILGSGTSAGVPMIGCHCAVCSSADPRDKRTRPSIVLGYAGKSVLVDTTPELRLQACAVGLDRIDAVVYTHAHADHIFGLDDLRRFNTILGAAMPLYANAETLATLRQSFSYAFMPSAHELSQGMYRPELAPVEITGPFSLFGRTWTPLELPHGRFTVLGFRIGDFAYCTDCNDIPPAARAQLRDLDVLIIDALRPRPHATHLSFAQALALIELIQPRRAYFTHLAHDISHADAEAQLPPHIRVLYDGQCLTV
jgi:phosphoribosyl 1,2-cyclic phosphate phosphodiesterase